MSERSYRGGPRGRGRYSLNGDSSSGCGSGKEQERKETRQYEGRGKGQYEGRDRRQFEGRSQYEGRDRGQYEGRGRGQYGGRGRSHYEGRARRQFEGRGQHEGRDDKRQFPKDEKSRAGTSSYSAPRKFGDSSFQDEGKFVKSDQSNPPKIAQPIKEGSKLLSRPDHGTAGRPIKLLSNYFKLNVGKNIIFHYDIEVIDKAPKKQYNTDQIKNRGMTEKEGVKERKVAKSIKKKVFEKLIQIKAIKDANPVYDGEKNMFTSEPLNIGEKAKFLVNLEEERETRKYEVTIQSVEKKDGSNEINLKSLLKLCGNESEIIMALNSILNYRETGHPQIQIRGSFFYLNQANLLKLDARLNIYFGHHQSVQSTEKGPTVLINLAAKAFHLSGSIIDYASKVLKRNITQGQLNLKVLELNTLRNSLKGVKIKVTHLPYRKEFHIEDVTDASAEKTTFIDKKTGNELTVAEYFKIKYGKLRFPFLNCLQMRTKQGKPLIYIPFEHCVILEGQPKIGKLSPFQTANMIKKTAIVPSERFRCIEDSCKDVLRESGEKMSEYDLSLDDKFISVTGRVLPKPCLGFSRNRTVTPDDRGVWNLSGNKFFQSCIDIQSWILIDFAGSDEEDLQKFQDFFISASKKVGLNFGTFLGVKQFGKDVSAERALRNAVDEGASFAVIILSMEDHAHNYDEIKFIADYQMNFVNQCFDQKSLEKFNDQVATNLCLKINAKLGGINHVLHRKPVIMKDSTMIMGADAVHFARGSSCPSIAAVVGSVDDHAFRYDLSCRIQENPDKNKISQELILDMDNIAEDLLRKYFEKRKKYPQNIIFFRDGVSEGQFQAVHDIEIGLIQKASQSVIGCIIPITFIVVTKRHQARFKPVNDYEGVGKCRNVPPGTTVDTDIVHPKRFDYFVNSHEGIQGTSKSSRYTVLHDDRNYTSDELQELSYYLCFTYNKCNRSISIPAPVKYADLACYRAKMYADFHIQKERKRLKKPDKFVALPLSAKQAIDKMGELKNTFFFV